MFQFATTIEPTGTGVNETGDCSSYYHGTEDRDVVEHQETGSSYSDLANALDYSTVSSEPDKGEASYSTDTSHAQGPIRASPRSTYIDAMVDMGVLPDQFNDGYVSLDQVANDNPYAGRGMTNMETLLRVMELSGEAQQYEDGCFSF
ncbi:MAG: hypothetical protein QF415_13040 [Candidatus Undinarchaeales archaeon]|jgi:hypothetical protein|nr:hypothetical protein [Candidatus Undinarchaeales archaeon]MDP7493977.1 hypothetical protein [Candidatus Undinarchaeales archaeon]